MAGTVLAHYERRVALGEIEADDAQRTAARRLDRLSEELDGWQAAGRGGRIASLFRPRAAPPRGVYLHGSVGRGKTMLMDLFHEVATFTPKRRLHFHEFMSEVHDRIQRGRATTDGDPIPFVAAEIAAEAGLLCFDELTITDIADAMILARLFKALFARGVVVVATSNAPPERLYWNGLNRALFLPFIDLLQSHVDVVELKAAKDFRLDKLAGRQLYFSPCDARAAAGVEEHWVRLTGHHPGAPASIDVKGRQVVVPLASMGVARFTFGDLCEKPLGALDYLHIAHAFHTIMLECIPVLTPARRNEARRLIHLIDTLYDNRNCLIVSAEAEPNQLYPEGDGAVLFERTASRLMEMRSEAYLAKNGRLAATD
ncbi:cell division protein ZapE [Hyphomicrobium sp.]|uniref:cell division protein ZapE n=1 Tax=Hyphomicrobium sp. TaxID=82 RepID=UPI0025C6821A|nr:cell division protein ZapE [Hyphomicrobium sp.]MCC7250978.1 AFG1 family ATPase [Hyphomicrobium sp.]